jgi:ATP-dependent helicase/nuclease subunit A
MWTDQQRRAIEHEMGDLLVSAAAGSGKTAVLAERCARLVCGGEEDRAALPAADAGPSAKAGRCGVENLLVVTFTEAAAREMRGRIAAAIRDKLKNASRTGRDKAFEKVAATRWLHRQATMVDRASISTLHGFCARVLRSHFHEVGIDPAFEVMDEDEARLLREEVLDALLAQWHARQDERGTAFGEFLEAYAEGRDGALRAMVLKVHDMLASVPDRERYKADARRVYDRAGGAEATMETYVQTCLGEKLRLARIAARRACAEVAGNLGTDKMLSRLEAAARAIEGAGDLLARGGAREWDRIREMLNHPMPRLTSVKIEGFQELKKRTWEEVKDLLKKLRDAFAPDPAEMLEDLQRIGDPGGPLETLLWMAESFDEAFTGAKRGEPRDRELSQPHSPDPPARESASEGATPASMGAGGARLDFHDLERLTYDLLTRPASQAAKELQKRYRYLLVDEFQDINPLQYALLTALRSEVEAKGNLFVVGDAKQSIYGFRLAGPGLFLDLERRWRSTVAQEKPGKTAGKFVGLPHNFRSQAKLIDVMNGLFGRLITPEVAGMDYWQGHSLLAARPPGNSPPAPGRIGTPADPAASADTTPSTDDAPRVLDGSPVEVHLVVMEKEEKAPPARPARPGEESEEEEQEEGEPAEHLSALEHEARVVAERIAQLVERGSARECRIHDKSGALRPVEYRDIAILLRSMKSKAMIFARALEERGIPAHAELSTGYFDTPEVRDTLALLHVLDNPKQDIPLATTMLGPYGDFAHDDLARIRLAYDRREVSFAEAVGRYAADAAAISSGVGDQVLGIHEVAGQTSGPPLFLEELADRVSAFFAKLGRWREKLLARPLHEGLAEIYAEADIFAYVAGLPGGGAGGGSGAGGGQRIANLQMLHQRALKFSGFRKQGLHRFLRFIEQLRDQEGDYGEAPVLSEASQVVRIMSVHKSKGLEFPVVFVSGLGGKLKLGNAGPLMVHRDLGIGMLAADVERNAFYPSAASLQIEADEARSNRAEELRLLYVALTRAREHLVLTGHVAGRSRLAGWRDAWKDHAGPLPEDLLLKGSTAIDWVMPAIACGGDCGNTARSPALAVRWNDDHEAEPAASATEPAGQQAQVTVTIHGATALRHPVATAPDMLERVEKIRAGAVLEEASDPPAEAVDRLLGRITGSYAHADAAAQPAVRTVTALKTISDQFRDEDSGEWGGGGEYLDQFPGEVLEERRDPAAAEAARLRGIATHRMLELLDFTDCATEEAMELQVARMVEKKLLTAEERAAADWPGIRWFLWHSAAGRRVIAASRALPEHRVKLKRELAFTWAAPLGTPAGGDPQDWPTVRGVIDVLIAEIGPAKRQAEIVDYKTDSLRLWETRLPEYRRQMGYYLQAASQILGFPVEKATLVFVAAREEREVPATIAHA